MTQRKTLSGLWRQSTADESRQPVDLEGLEGKSANELVDLYRQLDNAPPEGGRASLRELRDEMTEDELETAWKEIERYAVR